MRTSVDPAGRPPPCPVPFGHLLPPIMLAASGGPSQVSRCGASVVKDGIKAHDGPWPGRFA
jgi:hypothetical protein